MKKIFFVLLVGSSAFLNGAQSSSSQNEDDLSGWETVIKVCEGDEWTTRPVTPPLKLPSPKTSSEPLTNQVASSADEKSDNGLVMADLTKRRAHGIKIVSEEKTSHLIPAGHELIRVNPLDLGFDQRSVAQTGALENAEDNCIEGENPLKNIFLGIVSIAKAIGRGFDALDEEIRAIVDVAEFVMSGGSPKDD